MFVFQVFNSAGQDITSNIVGKSSGFVVPTGTAFVNQGTNGFYLPGGQSGTLSNITFSFAGRGANGQPLNNGYYSVAIKQINYNGNQSVQGQSSWKTPMVTVSYAPTNSTNLASAEQALNEIIAEFEAIIK